MLNHPIKILHVIPQIGIGGAEKQLYELIIHSDSSFMQHNVLYYSNSRDEEGYKLYHQGHIDFERIPRNKEYPIRFLSDLSDAIKKRKPDIVHCWLYSGVFWGRLAAIKAGCKHILLSYRSTKILYAPLIRCMERITRNRVHYLANSWGCAKEVARQLGIPLKLFSVIYNGIDVHRLDVPSIRENLYSELNIPISQKLVTMVGRLTEAKNYPMFLRLARRCHGNLPFHFLAVGHGESEGSLKQMAKEMGVAEIVHFLGLRMDVPSILKSSDYFCFTSWREGFPNSLLEAMAAGLPIVTTNCSGAEEVVGQESGIIIEKDKDGQAMEALGKLLTYPELARSLAKNGIQRSRDYFSIEVMVQNTLNYYSKLC